MTISPLGAPTGAAATQPLDSRGSGQSFGQTLGNTLHGGAPAARSEVSPTPVTPSHPHAVGPAAHVTEAHGTCPPAATSGVSRAAPVRKVEATHGTQSPTAARLIDRVSHAQAQMDHVLAQAQSGKAFSPAELLALQAQVYQSSQELDLAGKVVEKATSGAKQVLQTQV